VLLWIFLWNLTDIFFVDENCTSCDAQEKNEIIETGDE
jgi:hypothetical protein